MIFDHRSLAQRVLFETGAAVDNVAKLVEQFNASAVLLIASGSGGSVAEQIARRIPVVEQLGRVAQHVPMELAARATTVAEQHDADLIVAIGGGSAIGLAKAIAKQKWLPIIAVPTTFAGSEATDVWGITEDGHKTTGSHPRVLPSVIVYDAQLTQSLPGPTAVASGLNALAHAVDGFWAPRADPINQVLGSAGLRAVVPGLRQLHLNPADLQAHEQTLYGAYLCAVAFANAGSGLHHKICHVLGGRFGLPHPETHSIMLAYVTEFNAPSAPDAAARIRTAFSDTTQRSPQACLDEFRTQLGAPRGLKDIGLHKGDLGEAADLILPNVPPTNPRPVTRHDLTSILARAWVGTPLT